MRRLGDDLWEAVQPELGRRVALRRLAPGTPFDADRWPDRDGVPRLFAVVSAAGGTFVASRFVPGARTLAERGRVLPSRRRRWLAEAAAILDGAVHGDLTARDVLIDSSGHAWVTGFGRSGPGATEADDRAALQRLRDAPALRRRVIGAAAGATAAAGALAALVLSGDGAVPAVPAGAVAYGSTLPGTGIETVDCSGGEPGGGSLPCTIVQARLPAARLTAPAGATVRGWAVRGFEGRVALQIQRAVGAGFTTVGATALMDAPDRGETYYFRSDLQLPADARFALEVAPDTGIGIRSGMPGAATERFFSPLRDDVREADPSGGQGEELLLRVDVVPPPR